MRRDIPALRILPMSDKPEPFRTMSIEDVQRKLFLRDLPKNGARFRYQKSGLNADPWTVILFQYKARIIASATFLRDEKLDRAESESKGYAGAIYIDPASIRTFDPIDADAMRKAWPTFRGFGQVKQFLNADGYAAFKRRLKHVQRPSGTR